MLLLLWWVLGASGLAAEIPAALAGLAAHYHVGVDAAVAPVRVGTPFGLISGEPCSDEDVRWYAPLLIDEFGFYPQALVSLSRLQRIVLCRSLSFAGQPRQAVPDFQHHVLYLQADKGDDLSLYLRMVIHHEFYHMIDNEVGTLYRDPEWDGLNPPSFRYGNGGASVPRIPSEATSSRLYRGGGFVSRYAMAAPEEDKAETFAYLMVRYGHVMAQARTDVVLRAKVALLKTRLQAWSPEMDEAFWSDLAESSIVLTPRQR